MEECIKQLLRKAGIVSDDAAPPPEFEQLKKYLKAKEDLRARSAMNAQVKENLKNPVFSVQQGDNPELSMGRPIMADEHGYPIPDDVANAPDAPERDQYPSSGMPDVSSAHSSLAALGIRLNKPKVTMSLGPVTIGPNKPKVTTSLGPVTSVPNKPKVTMSLGPVTIGPKRDLAWEKALDGTGLSNVEDGVYKASDFPKRDMGFEEAIKRMELSNMPDTTGKAGPTGLELQRTKMKILGNPAKLAGEDDEEE